MPKFCMPFCIRNNTKTACICLYRVRFPTCIGKPGAISSARERQANVMPEFCQTVFALWRSSTVSPALWFHATECYGAVGREPACVASIVCQLGDCADRLAHARQDNLQPVLLSGSLSMLSGEIYLRSKLCLVVEISSDIVTEHCCQVCALSWCFAAPTAGCVRKWLGDCAIRKLLREPWDHVVWDNYGRPTWDIKIFFTFDFHILHLQRHIRAIIRWIISYCI